MKWIINIICTIAILIAILSAIIAQKAKASEEWNEGTYALHNKLQELGMDKNLAEYVINRCKETATNPRRCVNTASMIAKPESNMGRDASNNNVWGINEGKRYDSVYANFDRWLKSYNKYWYKSPLPQHYYPPVGSFSKTRYCTDEHSSKSSIGCPNGLKHATYVYNILNNL